MKVILIQDIKNIGKKGDLKNVADGYALNFLFPKNLAKKATDELRKKIEEENKRKADTKNLENELARKTATELSGKKFEVSAKSKGGKLFGAIGKKDIAMLLKKYGIQENQIILKEHLKKAGEYKIELKINDSVSTFVALEIKAE